MCSEAIIHDGRILKIQASLTMEEKHLHEDILWAHSEEIFVKGPHWRSSSSTHTHTHTHTHTTTRSTSVQQAAPLPSCLAPPPP